MVCKNIELEVPIPLANRRKESQNESEDKLINHQFVYFGWLYRTLKIFFIDILIVEQVRSCTTERSSSTNKRSDLKLSVLHLQSFSKCRKEFSKIDEVK